MPKPSTDHPPAWALTKWARENGVPIPTAKKWAREGGPLHSRTWPSGGVDTLIRPGEPVPAPRRAGRPAKAI